MVPVGREPALDGHFFHVVVLLGLDRRRHGGGRRLRLPVVPPERRRHRLRLVVAAAVRQHRRVIGEMFDWNICDNTILLRVVRFHAVSPLAGEQLFQKYMFVYFLF